MKNKNKLQSGKTKLRINLVIVMVGVISVFLTRYLIETKRQDDIRNIGYRINDYRREVRQMKFMNAKLISELEKIKKPDVIMAMLKKSCYDCHSYDVKIPWYGNVAPMSWEVRGHIKNGTAWLNFQEWKNYDQKRQQKLYKSIYESLSLSMPMPIYLMLHSDAKLTKEQRRMIEKWASKHSFT